MRVIEPYQLRPNKKAKPKLKASRLIAFLLVIQIIAMSILGVWTYSQPLPKISAHTVTVNSHGTNVEMPWPGYGQAAVGTGGQGLLEYTKNQKKVPIASVAKIMTAYSVLKAKPIKVNDQGPTISLNDTDEQLYNHYVSINGSVVPVSSGEQISERQALEALLLPSANNIADSLAIWAFGSVKNYSDYADKLAKELGLKNTSITSASGYDANTTSTAADLVRLGLVAMDNPVIANIVGMRKSNISIVGTVNSTNYLLGHQGIIGIKTGNTDEAGGCYLFAAIRKIGNGQKVMVVGAILGASDLGQAISDSLPILAASYKNFTQRSIVKSGDVLAYYDLPWGGQVKAIAKNDIAVWAWKGSDVKSKVYAEDIAAGTKANEVVGKVQNGDNSADMVLSSDTGLPGKIWRLTHNL